MRKQHSPDMKFSRLSIQKVRSQYKSDLKLQTTPTPSLLKTQQSLYIQETFRINQKLMENQRQSKQIKVIKVPETRDVDEQTENLQSGSCKVIFMPKYPGPNDFGFKTFTEMMKTNTNWMSQVPKLQSPRDRDYARKKNTEEAEAENHVFPQYLSNRLEFNKTSTEFFKTSMDQRWTNIVDEVSVNMTQLTNRREPKVRMIHHDKKPIGEEKEAEEDQQNEKQEFRAIQLKLKSLKFFWYCIENIEQWKPSNREGCTITYCESINKCILYGGIGKDLFNNFIGLNTKTWNWQDLGPGEGDAPLQGRFGHSANFYKKGLIIFGGEKKYNQALKMRDCYSDVSIYYPHNNSWVKQRTYGDIAEARRNHCAVLCGRFLFILGGVNSFGKYLRDVVSLNLDTMKWLTHDIEDFFMEGIAFASAVSLFKSEVKMENPYSYELIWKKGKRALRIGFEGIYIFGGRVQGGEALGDLQVLTLGEKPLKIRKIATKGIGPTPRYLHSMDYLENMNFCVIYGGRDDSVTKEGPKNIKNDIFLLEMHHFNWISIAQIGIPASGKCSHSSVFLGSKLMIFGGYSADSLNNCNLQFVEMDQDKTKLMVKEVKFRQLSKSISGLVQPIFTIKELQDDTQLKVFTTGHQMIVNNIPVKEDPANLLRKNSHKLTQNNFVSFQPLPMTEMSTLLKDFQQKKDQDRIAEIQLNLSRRGGGSKNSIRSKVVLDPLHVATPSFDLTLEINKQIRSVSLIKVIEEESPE